MIHDALGNMETYVFGSGMLRENKDFLVHQAIHGFRLPQTGKKNLLVPCHNQPASSEIRSLGVLLKTWPKVSSLQLAPARNAQQFLR